MIGILDRARTVAQPGYSRWLVPPAALAIHLCIGQVYSLSVFNLPLTRLVGITQSAPEDWKLSSIAAIFSVAIVFLGLSAALFGKWLERVGPRKAMFGAACCFSAGFLIQEFFPGMIKATAAAGFVGLLSLFNMSGRFFWSSISDKIGRKATYGIYFALGALLYGALPSVGAAQSVALFVAVLCVLISMYGGGFSAAPAYLRDLFGTFQVGAIHGRLLTAWSVAGVVGPLVINSMRQIQLARGIAPAQAYNQTMYLLGGVLVLGFISNLLVRPVTTRHLRATPVETLPTSHNAAGEPS